MENREEMRPETEKEEAAAGMEPAVEPMGTEQKKNMVPKVLTVLKRAFAPGKWKKTTAILCAVVFMAVVGITVINQNSPKGVAVRYCRGLYDNPKAIMRLSAYDFEKYVTRNSADDAAFFEEESNELMEDIDSWGDLYKVMRRELKNELEDGFGKYKIVLDVTKVRDISVKKLANEQKKLISKLEKAGCFDADEMKDGKEVTVKVKVVGEDETSRNTFQVYVVKMGFGWKVLNYDSNYDGGYDSDYGD